MALPLSGEARTSDIFALAAGSHGRFPPKAETAGRAAAAAIRLVKLSGSLPAVLAANAANIPGDLMRSVFPVEADAVERFAASARERVDDRKRRLNSAGIGHSGPLRCVS